MRTEKEICDMYENHNSLADVSRETKMSKSMIYRILKKNNVNTKRDSSDFIEKLYDYKIDNTFFEKIDTEEKAYILGFLYADGNLHKNNYHVKLKLQERDKYILEKINTAMCSNKPLYFHKKAKETHQNNLSIVISNKKMYGDLINLGLYPSKTYDLNFKKVFDDCFFKDFLRGYFDGDGWICAYDNITKYVSKKTKKTSISKYRIFEVGFTGTNFMCDFLNEFFIKKLNIKSHLQKDKRCDNRINNVKITNKDGIKKFYDFIYSDAHIFLTRKKEKFLEFLANE